MPPRLADVARILRAAGIEVEKPSTGSHWKARRPGERAYTLPAHNGLKTELDVKYIRGLCKHFGLDRALFEGAKKKPKP